ncbi:MAG TPA: ArsR family transcriptional regulator [Gemmatimonadales bacterium]|nr:ArsR family transcriptional regulator [Gemmatimonadales bacterium]
MPIPAIHERFYESTRGQVVRLLRRGERTVEELATSLELTSNAVRSHLAVLERDGLIRSAGVRRSSGAGKPATVYEMVPEAETMLSRGYLPLLRSLLQELGGRMDSVSLHELMRDTGERMALEQPPLRATDFESRVEAASALLAAIGAETMVERTERGVEIRGCSCALSAAVSERPEVCSAVQSLLTKVTGAEVREHCERGERPRCRFEILDSNGASGGD